MLHIIKIFSIQLTMIKGTKFVENDCWTWNFSGKKIKYSAVYSLSFPGTSLFFENCEILEKICTKFAKMQERKNFCEFVKESVKLCDICWNHETCEVCANGSLMSDQFVLEKINENAFSKLKVSEEGHYIKGCVCYIFVSLFLCLKESTCETRKNIFYFTSKALSVFEIIRF